MVVFAILILRNTPSFFEGRWISWIFHGKTPVAPHRISVHLCGQYKTSLLRFYKILSFRLIAVFPNYSSIRIHRIILLSIWTGGVRCMSMLNGNISMKYCCIFLEFWLYLIKSWHHLTAIIHNNSKWSLTFNIFTLLIYIQGVQ